MKLIKLITQACTTLGGKKKKRKKQKERKLEKNKKEKSKKKSNNVCVKSFTKFTYFKERRKLKFCKNKIQKKFSLLILILLGLASIRN